MPIINKFTNYTCGPKLYRPIWLWAEIDTGRNCYGPKCPVTLFAGLVRFGIFAPSFADPRQPKHILTGVLQGNYKPLHEP